MEDREQGPPAPASVVVEVRGPRRARLGRAWGVVAGLVDWALILGLVAVAVWIAGLPVLTAHMGGGPIPRWLGQAHAALSRAVTAAWTWWKEARR